MLREEYTPIIASMLNKLEPMHVLDYGCGADLPLAKGLRNSGLTCGFKYQAYDRTVPRFASEPFPADVVLCTQILGAMDELEAEAALEEMHRLTEAVAFLVITGSKMPATWWLPRIMCRFDLQTFQVASLDSFYVVAYALPRAIESVTGEKLS